MSVPASIASPRAIDRFMLFLPLDVCTRTLHWLPQPLVGGQGGLGLPSSGRRRDKELTLRAIPATSFFCYLLRPRRRSGCWVSLLRRSFPSSSSFQPSHTKRGLLPRPRHP